MLRPRLTTIRQDTQRMGALAAARLIQQIESPLGFRGETDLVSGILLEGESIGPVKG